MSRSPKDTIKRALTDPEARRELEESQGDSAPITSMGVDQRMTKAFADPLGGATRFADLDGSAAVRTSGPAVIHDHTDELPPVSDEASSDQALVGPAVIRDYSDQLPPVSDEAASGDTLVQAGMFGQSTIHDLTAGLPPVSDDVTVDEAPAQIAWGDNLPTE